MKYLFAFFFVLIPLYGASAQPITDSLFTWQGYGRSGTTHIQVFNNPSNSDRPLTIVMKEIADNTGPSIVSDIPYLTEAIGRSLGFDPAKAQWVLHWGFFSFRKAEKSKKEVFIRATFKRTPSNKLGSPQWRVIDREEVEKNTDRQYK